MPNTHRQWLIAALSARDFPGPMPVDAAELAVSAENEGILLLLMRALPQHPQAAHLPAAFCAVLEQAARPALMAQLAMLAEQYKVLHALQSSGRPFLVLKGGALGHWLYKDPSLRMITDLDVLIADRNELPYLQTELGKMAYQLNAAAGSRIGLQQAFMKNGGPYGEYAVDVHWRLLNSMQLQHCFSFTELYESAIEFLPGVKGLSPVHAMLHACAHRGLNLPYRHAEGVQRAQCLRWLWDIHLLAAALSESQWLELCRLCESKRLSALVLDGLQAALLECRSAVPAPVLEDLQRQKLKLALTMRPFQSWPAYQWHELCASADSISGRLQWLYQRLWPNVEAMRARYGHDGDSDGRILWRRFIIGLRRLVGMK
jgi:Uncharacterised nucleotidyltransferase